ncbi:MAG: AmmeMemoRadiSam system radical SAM enzyme [Candidatus Margulisiibacteriota bacterium]|nr:AmmeMemoRadiSam system radical SAM enzyme [Candidatus Margulisiibacteriota bacterium]
MRRYVIAVICSIFIAVGVVYAIQFTSPFSKASDALKMIRENNLSKFDARYWKKLEGDIVQCQLCPNMCVLPNLARGKCGVRININGKLYSLVYGKPIAVHVDPIEKKPLSHFLPGTPVLSIATAGCNLGCIFCQNWQISQTLPEDTEHGNFFPDDLVALAKRYKTPSIAYTYTEPTIFYEYMLDTAKLAKKHKIKNVMHSCGYINPKPLKELLRYMDAANVDLKGFSEGYYQKMCYGRLQPVLETLKTIKKEGVWLEITNLIIPGKNDDPKMIRKMCKWIKKELGPNVPIYFSAFHPNYRLKGVPPTSIKTLEMAYKIAKGERLNYVYIGNVYGHIHEDTVCPNCKRVVIKRKGFSVIENNLVNGRCKYCGERIPGVWN